MLLVAKSWISTICIGFLFLVICSIPAAPAEIERVKLSLDILSAAQQQTLTKNVITYANLAASLEHCGFTPDMERRAIVEGLSLGVCGHTEPAP